ncbi:MAG: glutamate mutase L [Anaerolineae bacterium]
MVDEHTIESVLIADCGTVVTKLLLLERVEASYRFVAQAQTLTTLNPPWGDLSTGVIHAIEELEEVTGRTIYAGGHVLTPREGLQGVDAFVVILSATEPLRLILAGLVREMSLESARRAASSTYTSVEAMLSREGSLQSPEEAWARSVRDTAPDMVLLVGGVDGGASRPIMELADAIALGTSMLESERRPVLIYAGNAKLRSRITKLLGDITTVEVVDNVRPTVDVEHLGPVQELLERFFIDERLLAAPGADALAAWSGLTLQPTATAFGRVVEYLWHHEDNPERGVLGVDLGAASTTVAACFDGQLYLSVLGEHGVAYGPLAWLKNNDIVDLMRWLPEDLEEERVLSMLHNRELRPWTIPQELQDLWVEQAVVREMLRSAVGLARTTWDPGSATQGTEPELMPRCDPILVSGGGIVHMPRPGQALLAVLDGIQPVGISTMLLDVNRAAPALGAVAGIKPLAAASALEMGTLTSLGTIISPVGTARLGDPVLKMKIVYEDETVLNVEANYGDLEIWPLLPGQRATLEIRPSRRFDIGFGPGRGGKIQALGGLVGLVVDGRGRPLTLPDNAETRQKLLRRWVWDVGG